MNDDDALRMRNAGKSYEEIADALGVTETEAYEAVKRALTHLSPETRAAASAEYFDKILLVYNEMTAMAARCAERRDAKNALLATRAALISVECKARMMGIGKIVLTEGNLDPEIRRLEKAIGGAMTTKTVKWEYRVRRINVTVAGKTDAETDEYVNQVADGWEICHITDDALWLRRQVPAGE